MYVHTQLQTYLYRCMHASTAVVHEHAYSLTFMNVGIQVCTLVHENIQNLLVAWDVILGHVEGPASESSAYTLYDRQNNPTTHVG